LRVSRHANAFFHLGAGALGASLRPDGALRVDTAKGPLVADHVVFCTGFRTDWAQRPEFAALQPHVRLWQDRFAAPAGEDDAELAESPDLGPLFEFQQKQPGACPGLERVHCYNYAAALSQGAGAGDIPQITDGAQRLARGLAAQLLAEDIPVHFANMQAYAEPELQGHEWTEAAFPVYSEGGSRTAGPPQGASAPSGGSDGHAVPSVGATRTAGPPQGASAPPGGSDGHAVPSVGAT
jgi:cation diffusion facilitator CzcD-associated flavoprotein CzcO